MIALEAALFAVTITAAGAQAEARPEETEPPAELIEFLGDWTQEEGKLIDEYRPPKAAAPEKGEGRDKAKAVVPGGKPEEQDADDEVSPPKYGPRS